MMNSFYQMMLCGKILLAQSHLINKQTQKSYGYTSSLVRSRYLPFEKDVASDEFCLQMGTLYQVWLKLAMGSRE